MDYRKLLVVCSLLFAITLFPRSARADHPVKEISIKVLRTQPHYTGWTTADHVMRQVEFANRVFANAGIQFKFDPSAGFLDVTDPDLACWYDDKEDDNDVANYYAATNQRHILLVVPTRHAPAEGEACVTATCYGDINCCPYHYDFGKAKCQASVGCDTATFQCMPSGYWAGIPVCFDDSCSPRSQGCTRDFDPSLDPTYFVRFRPLLNPGIMKLAHELGHQFGLQHPWVTYSSGDATTSRCYDETEGDIAKDCASSQPAGCMGAHPSCPSNQPWRNIMSYYDDCQTRYAGEYATSGWNVTLSRDQIEIVGRAVGEYWDADVEGPDDAPWQYGGYERMQVAMSSGAREYVTWDGWSSMSWLPVGESGWTKGNVKIKAADVNGDGFMDAIVTAASGPHPNTTLWLRQYTGNLVYAQTLVGGYGLAANVSVGNFTGDSADDVVVWGATSTTFFFEGEVGGSTMSTVAYKSWGTDIRVEVGNFGGKHELPVPMPAGYTRHQDHQDDIDNSGTYNNISYDDIVLVTSTGSWLYYGGSTLDLNSADAVDLGTLTYSAVGKVYAANVAGDYHDEMIMRTMEGFWAPTRLRVKKGADAFLFSQDYTTYTFSPYDPVALSTGDLAGGSPFYGDLLITSPAGTKLYLGGSSGPATTAAYTRTDLTTSNTKHATADFIRGGHDDVMFYTPNGSWLYAGARQAPYLIPNVWSDSSLTYSTVEWFGTQ